MRRVLTRDHIIWSLAFAGAVLTFVVPRSYAGQSAPWRLLDACPRCGEERMVGRNELGGWCDVCGASWP